MILIIQNGQVGFVLDATTKLWEIHLIYLNHLILKVLIFLTLKIQTLVATAALSSPLERALFPSASTDGGATLKAIVKNVIISSSSLPLAFHPLCNNSWLQDCGMAQVACWALGCSLGLADGQTWAKLVSDQLGLISPQVVHVLSAKQQFSELLHERSDLSGGPCHSFCNKYFSI